MDDRSRVRVRTRLDPGTWRAELRVDVRRGMARRPRTLPPKYFYDVRGSRLFEEITRQPEYYLTRTERRILRREAASLVRDARAEAVVEFGSGSGGKTRILLDAMAGSGELSGYAPVDVSPEAVGGVAREFAARYRELRVEGLVADFTRPAPLPFGDRTRLVLLLGSTIGNFTEPEARSFLRRVAGRLGPGDSFLVGFDLVKERGRLERAYDDAAGVTADFNRNVLLVLNRELDATFHVPRFRHRAVYDEEEARIEMHLVANRAHQVKVRELGMTLDFEEGESIRTELSHKYTRPGVERLLESAGLELLRWETDEDDLFAVALTRPAR